MYYGNRKEAVDMHIWEFIQYQLLGMKWLEHLVGTGLSSLGLDLNGRIGGSIHFFVYDALKITLLLCLLIFMISYVQSYFPPERSKRILSRFHGFSAHILSALLGTVTPFCSCSSIPLFIGFTRAGLPLGVTFSFLISSPMVDLGSLVLLMSIFGAQVAIIYVALGLVIAVTGGVGQAQVLDTHADLQVGLGHHPVEVGLTNLHHRVVGTHGGTAAVLAPALMTDFKEHRAGQGFGSHGVQLQAHTLTGAEHVVGVGVMDTVAHKRLVGHGGVTNIETELPLTLGLKINSAGTCGSTHHHSSGKRKCGKLFHDIPSLNFFC